ncbi:MAG: hypothetical protein KC656_23955, partial [Myxococcales bacterium]|nr:hypothetical protein [Myxococcales bacterium]
AGAPPEPRSDVYALGRLLMTAIRSAPQVVPRDLQAIVDRAMSARPEARYPHAGALADDLARWLDGLPVEAYVYTPRELVLRLVHAWRVPLAAGSAVALVAIALLALAGVRTARERDRALSAEARLTSTAAALYADRAASALLLDHRGEAEQAARSSSELVDAAVARGVLAAFGAPQPLVRGEVRPLPCPDVLLHDAEGTVCATPGGLEVHGRDARTLSLPATDAARSGDMLAVLADDALHLVRPGGGPWSLRTAGASGLVSGAPGVYVDRTVVSTLTPGLPAVAPCPGTASVDTAAVGPDGRWWVVCDTGSVVEGRGEDVREVGRVGPVGKVVALALCPDAACLLLGTLRGRLVRVDLRTGREDRRLETGLEAIAELVVAPDGAHALAVDQRGATVLWRPDGAGHLGRTAASGVRHARWVDASTLELVTDALETWTVHPQARPYGWNEDGGIGALAVSPDGSTLAVGVGPHVVLRRLPDGAPLRASSLHGRVV